jgi:Type II intron maturase
MENESKSWKKINSKKSLKPLDKIFIIRHILKFHSNKFLISQTKAHHVIKILVQKFPNLIWPIQVPQNIPLPPNINFKNITKKNKISYLAELINFLESIQYSIKNNFIIKKKLKFKNNLINVTKLKNLIEHSRHPIINANLKIIYQKLRKSDILKINSMKVNSKKSVLLFEDHKIIELFSIIARNILEYFSCCDNFAKAKFAVFYFIKFSLASTLKHKHKLSSIQKVFEIYGKNISVIHPKKVDTNISYITNYQINT